MARALQVQGQLLDQLIESKKGLAEGALQADAFVRPKESEDESGLQVIEGLESSVKAPIT